MGSLSLNLEKALEMGFVGSQTSVKCEKRVHFFQVKILLLKLKRVHAEWFLPNPLLHCAVCYHTLYRFVLPASNNLKGLSLVT